MISVVLAEPSHTQELANLERLNRTTAATERDGEIFVHNEARASLPETSAVGPDSLVLVGLIGEAPCGYAWVEFAGNRAAIRQIFVAPQCRGVGLGHAILTEILERARQAGCAGVDSMALPGDRETKNFFEAHAMKARLITVGVELGE